MHGGATRSGGPSGERGPQGGDWVSLGDWLPVLPKGRQWWRARLSTIAPLLLFAPGFRVIP